MSDTVSDALDAFKNRVFHHDVREAFRNIPAGKVRACTSGVVILEGKQLVVTFDQRSGRSVAWPHHGRC